MALQEITVSADCMRGQFNYGFNHHVTFRPTPRAFQAIIQRYQLDKFDFSFKNGTLYFSTDKI